MLFRSWHIFTKFKYYFDTCFTYTKSLTHGKYKLLISQKISLSQNFMGSMPIFPTISQNPKYYFGKNNYFMLEAQMLIWHYLQSPNINLVLPFKAQILFWQLFHKTQMLFWHIFTKCKYYFDTCFTYTKSLTHGKYNYLSLKKYLSYKIYKSPCILLMAKDRKSVV